MIPDLSKERIREILRQRGIPDDLIDEALTAF
jgi:SOS response regulatory protein OraA/RecX